MRTVRYLVTTLLLCALTVSFTGCFILDDIEDLREKQEKYAEDYLSQITVDIEGYELLLEMDGKESSVLFELANGDYIVQGTEITIDSTYGY